MPSKRLPPFNPPVPPTVEAVVPLPHLVCDEDSVDAGAGGRSGAVWRQIAATLRQPIERGEWPPGARLPIELELAAHFRVNRHTVRRALAELARDGLVATVQGRGTFITAGESVRYVLDGQDPISDALWRGPSALSSALVRDRKVEAGVKMGGMLALPSIHGLHEVELRLLADEVPVALATLWLARDRFPRFVDALRKAGSVQKALAAYGLEHFQPRSTTVSARPADDRECGLLKTKVPTMLTVVEAVADHRDDGGTVVPAFVIQTALCTARVDLHVVHATHAP